MRRAATSRRRRQAGVATAEAIIAMPCLALIFAAILYVGQTAHRKQALLAQTRNCAWQFALAGCQKKGELSNVCQAALSAPGVHNGARAVLAEHVDADVLTEALNLPVLGDVLEQLVGRQVSARLRDTRERPTLLGGGELATSATTVVLCNTVPVEAKLFDTLFDKYWNGASSE